MEDSKSNTIDRRQFFEFIRTLKTELDEPELLRLLNANSTNTGRRTGERQRENSLDGEIGRAAVCTMDYHWPTAFNSDFIMERDKTLMQGHDRCNHRYIDTT